MNARTTYIADQKRDVYTLDVRIAPRQTNNPRGRRNKVDDKAFHACASTEPIIPSARTITLFACLCLSIAFITPSAQAEAVAAAVVGAVGVAVEGVVGEERRGDAEVAAVAVAVTAAAAVEAVEGAVAEAVAEAEVRQTTTTTTPGPHRAGSRLQGQLLVLVLVQPCPPCLLSRLPPTAAARPTLTLGRPRRQ